MRNEDQEKAKHIFDTETMPALETTQAKMKALGDQLHDIQESSEKKMSSIGSRAQWSASVVTVAAVIIGILLSFFVIRSITRPILRIIEGLNAGSEQAQGIGQVNTAVAEMDKVVQQNAANAEESASASEEMNAQAEQMKEFVNDLVELVGGSKHSNEQNRPLRRNALKTFTKRTIAVTDRPKTANGMKVAVHKAKEVGPEQVIPMDEDF